VLRGGFRRTGEIEELGTWLGTEGGARPALTEALGTTLGDPSLELVFWVPEREGYVDSGGRWVDPPPPGSSRALVQIDLAGRRVGAIIYDATLIADPEPVRQASRVVAIAVDHERLTAEVLASREELRESRARIVEAGDAERRRIAQDLHDGLQARLVTLALKAYAVGDDPTASGSVREEATELRAGIDTAAAELRQLVHGVMPALLIERGLYAATEDLVDRMPIPTRLALSGNDHGLSPVVQSTAYFTLSEGLTNAVKHARASRLEVSLARSNGLLNIEIGDDGIGGAAAGWGVGLRGLTDRLDVLGGTLRVQSSPTQGTRLLVEVPCG
jgi:signal transduction histidine kinase